MQEKYGYFGPKGTNSEEALYIYLRNGDIEAQPYMSIEYVLRAVKSGEITYGLVPVENSIEGSVNLTLDLLAQEDSLKIVGEVVLPIRHHLLVKPGTKIGDINQVISHSQALAQCRKYLSEKFRDREILAADSTAEAARIVADGMASTAAIASRRAADYYHLEILEQDIHDCKENKTRFIIVAKEAKPVETRAKTSLLISITDRPGGLHEILKEFAMANINLTKIESRPAKRNLGDYLFFIDLVGHIEDPVVQRCLDNIGDMAATFRVLGTYPAWQEYDKSNTDNLPYPKQVSLEDLRQNIDIIDYQIVELLAKRTQLVSLVGTLKSDPYSKRDKKREEEVLKKVKNLAVKKGVCPFLLEEIYKYLFEHFVKLQEAQTSCKN